MAKGRILIFQGEHSIHLDGDVIEVEKKHKRRMKDGSYRIHESGVKRDTVTKSKKLKAQADVVKNWGPVKLVWK